MQDVCLGELHTEKVEEAWCSTKAGRAEPSKSFDIRPETTGFEAFPAGFDLAFVHYSPTTPPFHHFGVAMCVLLF